MPKFNDHPEHLLEIMTAAIAAADPHAAVQRHWPKELDHANQVHTIAVGKASLGMARAACELLGNRLVRGVVIAVPELIEAHTRELPNVTVIAANHPLPTQRNIQAANLVAQTAAELGQGDTLLLLLSGGGSAHLTLPAQNLQLEDLRAVTQDLLKAGAPIEDLNCIRKHCEQLKGGRLAQLAAPARIWTLALSDVIGNKLDVIASGPTVPDPTTFDDALATLDQYGLTDKNPAIAAHIEQGRAGTIPETPKLGDPAFANARHAIIGSNSGALLAAMDQAEHLGFTIAGFESDQVGETHSASRNLARQALELQANGATQACLAIGGETTVNVQDAPGIGGPCQELALAAALELDGSQGIAIAAFTTDGIDGPTDAAGAIITGQTAQAARNRGLDPATILARHDSQRLLQATNSLIRTGPTGTNVNDLALALLY